MQLARVKDLERLSVSALLNFRLGIGFPGLQPVPDARFMVSAESLTLASLSFGSVVS